jgi:hypothetical protein
MQSIADRGAAERTPTDWRDYNYVCTGQDNCLAVICDAPESHREVLADFLPRVSWKHAASTFALHGCVAVNYERASWRLKARVRAEGTKTSYVRLHADTHRYDSDVCVLVDLMRDGRSWRTTAGYQTPKWGNADQFAEACALFLNAQKR